MVLIKYCEKIIPMIVYVHIVVNLINKIKAELTDMSIPDLSNNPSIPNSVNPIPPGSKDITPMIPGTKFMIVESKKL